MILGNHYKKEIIVEKHMRKSILFLLLLLTGVALKAKNFEGEVVYKVEVKEVKPEASLAPQMIPETVKAYIKGEKLRIELQTMMTVTLLSDAVKQDAYTLVDMFGLKYALEMNTDEWKKGKQKADRIKIGNTQGKKTIAGIPCKKAMIIDTKGSYRSEVYYAEKYKIDEIFGLGFDFLSNVNGLPMEFTMEAGGLVLHVVGKSIKPQTISSSKFIVPNDYEKADSEQILKLLGIE